MPATCSSFNGSAEATYERNVDDRLIRVGRSELNAIARVVIDIVVVMRRWTMLVGIVASSNAHAALPPARSST